MKTRITQHLRNGWNNVIGERTVASELMRSTILLCFTFAILGQRNQVPPSGSILLLERVFPVEIWLIILFFASITGILGVLLDRLLFRRWAALTNIGIWSYVVAGLLLYTDVWQATTIGIYATFLVSSLWSYLSIQHEIRLAEQGRRTMTIAAPIAQGDEHDHEGRDI